MVIDAHCTLVTFFSCHHQFPWKCTLLPIQLSLCPICPKEVLWWHPQDTKYFQESKNFQITFQFIFFPSSPKMETLYYRIIFIFFSIGWPVGFFFLSRYLCNRQEYQVLSSKTEGYLLILSACLVVFNASLRSLWLLEAVKFFFRHKKNSGWVQSPFKDSVDD